MVRYDYPIPPGHYHITKLVTMKCQQYMAILHFTWRFQLVGSPFSSRLSILNHGFDFDFLSLKDEEILDINLGLGSLTPRRTSFSCKLCVVRNTETSLVLVVLVGYSLISRLIELVVRLDESNSLAFAVILVGDETIGLTTSPSSSGMEGI